MSESLINRMKWNGFVVDNGVFYEVYGNRIFTTEQAINWLNSLS